MRATVLTGLFACVVIATISSTTASAEAQSLVVSNNIPNSSINLAVLTALELSEPEQDKEPEAEVVLQPTIHTVAPNENLSTIAEKFGTTWVRLFNKNVQVEHPDHLKVGDTITVPLADEQLAERPLPEPPVVVAPPPAPTAGRARTRVTASSTMQRGSTSGNTYTPGYCTWYAKNMRPDLPNNLGNARTWVSRAAAQGLPTGNTPRVGAIGQQGNHVVYVRSVNGDGTVTVSEMNYRGLYTVSSRTVSASNFRYIY